MFKKTQQVLIFAMGASNMKGFKPKGKQGLAQVKKLGRTYKTGGFNKIASSAAKRYGSVAAGKRVAGAVFQRMVRKHVASKHA